MKTYITICFLFLFGWTAQAQKVKFDSYDISYYHLPSTTLPQHILSYNVKIKYATTPMLSVSKKNIAEQYLNLDYLKYKGVNKRAKQAELTIDFVCEEFEEVPKKLNTRIRKMNGVKREFYKYTSGYRTRAWIVMRDNVNNKMIDSVMVINKDYIQKFEGPESPYHNVAASQYDEKWAGAKFAFEKYIWKMSQYIVRTKYDYRKTSQEIYIASFKNKHGGYEEMEKATKSLVEVLIKSKRKHIVPTEAIKNRLKSTIDILLNTYNTYLNNKGKFTNTNIIGVEYNLALAYMLSGNKIKAMYYAQLYMKHDKKTGYKNFMPKIEKWTITELESFKEWIDKDLPIFSK